MYRNRLYIDGEDMYLVYGAFVVDDLKDVVCFPSMKQVAANEWPEEDGSDVDLTVSGYHYDVRSITLKFGFHGGNKDESGFIEYISDGAYHDFVFKPLTSTGNAVTLTLRLESNPSINDRADGRLGLLSFKFSDDLFTYKETEAVPAAATIVASDDYKINGIRLTDYNVSVLKGTLDSIRKMSDTKQNVTVKQSVADGVVYDPAYVFFKSRDVKLNCLMRASDLEAFWSYHRRLFALLTAPGGHVLHVGATDTAYPCYYKSCAVSKFYTEIGGIVWMSFTLTFTLTGNLRKDTLSGSLLATEGADDDAMAFITTEDGAYIDMKKIR